MGLIMYTNRYCIGGVFQCYCIALVEYVGLILYKQLCIVLVEYDEANIVHAVVALHWWSMWG